MSLQIRTNKVCSCRGLLLSHYVEEKRLHAFSMQLTQKTPPPPCPSYKTLLAPLLNASAMTSCQTLLILLAPKIIFPNPKSSPSPQMLGVKRVFMTGFAANWLRSTCFYKLTLPSELATPFGPVGNALEKAWRLGPAPSERAPLPPALGGAWALRRARQITQIKFCACPTNDS